MTLHPSVKVVAFFVSLHFSFIYTFNVQELPRSVIYASYLREINFGYSVLMTENESGKWLVVGAPKFSSATKTGAPRNKNHPRSGAIFTCNLNLSAKKTLSRKKICRRLLVQPEDRETKIIFSCNFENCTLENLPNQDKDWAKINRETPSNLTGPSHDHTYAGTKSGYYLYMETSTTPGQRDHVGQGGMVSTPLFQATSGACVKFWYHMFGKNIGSLNIYIHTNETGLIMIWNKNGPQGNKWNFGHVTVISKYNYKVVFEAIKGDGYNADVGIDDIVISEGQCSEDIGHQGQSIGSSLNMNPNTGQLVACAPTWKHNCSGNIQVKGLCYMLDKNFNKSNMTILSPALKQVCNTALVDLVFLIDESASLVDIEFASMRYWLRNIISSLPISGKHTQVGVAAYNKKTRVLFHLNDFHRVEDIRLVLEKAKKSGGGTFIGKAINFITDEMFTSEHGMRKDAKRVAVVITDANSHDDVVGPSKRAKEKGISLVSIGVGKVMLSQLQAIASDPDDVYLLDGVDALETIRNQIKQSITALESQGKAYTTQQSQSGFSSTFVRNDIILGLPGLNDWSGGYATYSNKQRFPTISSFQNFLEGFYQRKNSTRNNITGSYTMTVTELSVTESGKHETKDMTPNSLKLKEAIESDASLRKRQSVLFPNQMLNSRASYTYTELKLPYKTDDSYKTTSPSTALPIQVEVNIPNAKNESLPLQPENDIVLKTLSNAYFGYSLEAGSFSGINKTELAVGAPRLLSKGGVYVMKKYFTENEKGDQILLYHESKQMGSYFGYTLCATDTNGDGVDELFVGAPLWMDKFEDEGRVFVYTSEKDQSHNNEVVLEGLKERGARFGFSIAKAGDLNYDGYNDLVVGAPSYYNGDGAVYIYNGGPDIFITRQPSQVIKASDKKRNSPVFFGFSIFTGVDIDGNQYNDIAVGAPGNDRVVVLMTRPVMHVSIDISASPSHFNLSSGKLEELSASCSENGTSICSEIASCFSLSGVNVPESVVLYYELASDTLLHKPRAQFAKRQGVVKVTSQSKVCIETTLYIELPVRHQLTPLNLKLSYHSNERKNSKALIDAFAPKQAFTNISFANNCQNKTCKSDLDLVCIHSGKKHSNVANKMMVISNLKMVVIDVFLSNLLYAAYDVHMDIHFNNQAFYLVQVVPVNGSRCMRDTGIGLLADKNGNQGSSAALDILQLQYINPIMFKNQACIFSLQFGVKESFKGGNVKFSLASMSSSKEINSNNNDCELDANIFFEADYKLKGLTTKDQTKFAGNVSSILYFEDIGPATTHSYTIINTGPSSIPHTSIQISWPTETVSGHDFLYLTRITCQPKELCKCQDLDVLVNPEHINKTGELELMANRGKGSVVIGSDHINPKTDKHTGKEFHEVQVNCNNGNIICETLRCSFGEIASLSSARIDLDFRIWEQTFQEANIWKASLSSNAVASVAKSKFLVLKNGNKLGDRFSKVTTSVFNENFAEINADTDRIKLHWWIYVIAILSGILLLLITVLILKRAGFFKSKYRQHIEDEIEWKQTYRYTAAQQKMYEGSRDQPCGNPELSTFQRRLPQSPTL